MKPTVTTVVSVHMTGEEVTELRRAIVTINQYVASQNNNAVDSKLVEHMLVLNSLKGILPLSSK